jgi:hypothetical protein
VPVTDPRPLSAALSVLDVSVRELWFDYVGLGGNLEIDDVRSFLSGQQHVAERDYDLLVQAANDRFVDIGQDHPLAYTDEL